jgi:hypothetical protein
VFQNLSEIAIMPDQERGTDYFSAPVGQSAYRLLWPREAFLTLALFAPRAPVRGAFGAAFFRAARFTFLRSILSVMLFVFAMYLANLSLGAIFRT